MKILIILILFSFQLFSIELLDRSSNSVDLKIDNINEKYFKLYKSKNGKDFDKEYTEVSVTNGKIKNLEANKYYKLVSEVNELKFWTLAEEPNKAKTNLTFLKANANAIKIKAYIDNADGALLIATLKKDIDKPIDGKSLKIGKFGEINSKIGESFVVGDLKNKEEVILENLKYGIYTFTLVPYNGNGESINFNTNKLKLRETHPQLAVPKQKECEYFKDNVAEIKWNKVEGVKYYEVTVCEDRNCNNVILEYDEANFGDGLEWKLFFEDENKKYYWKIRAVGLYNSSEYSEVMVIDYDYINSAKK